MWSSWLRALVLLRGQIRPGGGHGPHALYLIGTSDSLVIVYSSVEIWQPCVWCCCCCCGDEKYTTIHGCLVNIPVSSQLWGIWTVKATDELCTRTFAVHTLKSPLTKMSKFPDGGQTLPDGGGGSSPLKPLPRGTTPEHKARSKTLPSVTLSCHWLRIRILQLCDFILFLFITFFDF